MSEFSLEGRDYIALNDLLKITGLCESGGAAKIVIAEGKIKVGDQIELSTRATKRILVSNGI